MHYCQCRCCSIAVGTGVLCNKPACNWLVEGQVGFCQYGFHAPGTGVILAVKAYLEKNDDTIPLSVEDPADTVKQFIKNEALANLEANIRWSIGEHTRGDIVLNNGYLYCYRDIGDPVPFDTRTGQRPLKCGRANSVDERIQRQQCDHGKRGGKIKPVGSEYFPFIDQLDSYMKLMLKWWKLPCRGGDGGTEWYYISLSAVEQIWSYGKDKAFEVAEGADLGLDRDAYTRLGRPYVVET